MRYKSGILQSSYINFNLKMGSSGSNQYTKNDKKISVITLNYSGILLSPFEFFSKEKKNKQMTNIEQSLSRIFQELLKSAFPDFSANKKQNKFEWKLGKIDQKMQFQRYSTLYHPTAGISNGKLISLQQYAELWQKTFSANASKIKDFQFKPEQRQQARLFDQFCYKSILIFVYGIKGITFDKISSLNPKPYQEFMTNMFNKSFLNEQKKLQKTFASMQKQNLDIFFAQQVNQTLINQLSKIKKYVIFQSEKGNSLIIVRRQKFSVFYSLKKDPLANLPEIKKKLFWNQDTVVAFVDNLILISGHLSSKKQKNPQQVYDMVQSLRQLSDIYPMCHIIVGIDGNSFVPDIYKDYCKKNFTQQKALNESFPQNWSIYPNNDKLFTTSKQRTYMQPQIKKAEEVARVCRDHLILVKSKHIKFQQTKVCTISGNTTQLIPNLPCEEHPYDHYVVKAEILVNVVTKIQNH